MRCCETVCGFIRIYAPFILFLFAPPCGSLLSTTVSKLFILFIRDDEHDFPGYGFVVCGKENATGMMQLLKVIFMF